MASHVRIVEYRGPELSGNVGYRPRWHHLLPWPIVLPGLLLANALLQVGDVASTWWALSHGAVEANPVSRSLMATWGFSGWVWAKLSLATLFAAHVPFLKHLNGNQHEWIGRVTATFAVMMLATVIANTAQTIVAT